MIVKLSGLFNSYTKGVNEISVEGETVAEIILKLDQLFPGIKFRFINEQDLIRKHINIFLNHKKIKDISISVKFFDKLYIVQALSGG